MSSIMGNLNTAFNEIMRNEAAEAATERAARRAVLRQHGHHETHWYVAHSGSGRGERAIVVLKQEGIEHYYPQVRTIRYKPRDKMSAKQRRAGIPIKEISQRPLFPGYVFVQISMCALWWREVFERAGIRGLICGSSDALPCQVLEREIERIRASECNGVVPDTIRVKEMLFKPGERVRIGEGAFAGFNATVEKILDEPVAELDESARVKLLVSLFGRETVAELPLCDIEKL